MVTRTPDVPHLATPKCAAKGGCCEDCGESARRLFGSLPGSPTSGCIRKPKATDAAVAMAMGHAIPREFYLDGNKSGLSSLVTTNKTDFPICCCSSPREDGNDMSTVAFCVPPIWRLNCAGQTNNPE